MSSSGACAALRGSPPTRPACQALPGWARRRSKERLRTGNSATVGAGRWSALHHGEQQARPAVVDMTLAYPELKQPGAARHYRRPTNAVGGGDMFGRRRVSRQQRGAWKWAEDVSTTHVDPPLNAPAVVRQEVEGLLMTHPHPLVVDGDVRACGTCGSYRGWVVISIRDEVWLRCPARPRAARTRPRHRLVRPAQRAGHPAARHLRRRPAGPRPLTHPRTIPPEESPLRARRRQTPDHRRTHRAPSCLRCSVPHRPRHPRRYGLRERQLHIRSLRCSTGRHSEADSHHGTCRRPAHLGGSHCAAARGIRPRPGLHAPGEVRQQRT